jgi:hypothetical protein
MGGVGRSFRRNSCPGVIPGRENSLARPVRELTRAQWTLRSVTVVAGEQWANSVAETQIAFDGILTFRHQKLVWCGGDISINDFAIELKLASYIKRKTVEIELVMGEIKPYDTPYATTNIEQMMLGDASNPLDQTEIRQYLALLGIANYCRKLARPDI